MERAASAHDVPDEAILAVLLKTGTVGFNVVDQARRLLKAFGGIQGLVSSDWRSLESRIKKFNSDHPQEQIKGLGHVKCLELAAAFELGFRGVRAKPEEIRLIRIRTAADAYRLFKSFALSNAEQENFLVIPVDARQHPLCEPIVVFRGTVDSAPVYAREVFREAVRWGAKSVVIAHNHPSGDPTPGEIDIDITRELVSAGELLGVDLLDHLVIGAPASNDGHGFVSMKESGLC